MPDEDLVNALAQYLDLEPLEKQALLERDGLRDRAESLIELLEMKVLVARHKWDGKGDREIGAEMSGSSASSRRRSPRGYRTAGC